MILVLLGTNPYPFHRLLDAVERWALDNGERVVAQCGTTPVKPGMDCVDYVAHSQILTWIDEADIVVCQGGFGSLQDCISKAAKTVAVPRKIAMGESVDDQEELVRALADEDLLLPVYDIEQFSAVMDAAKTMQPVIPEAGGLQEDIAATVRQYLGR